jgi:putative ribosome biogenesis GTPase RsgA
MPYLAFENKMDSEASKSKGNTLRLCRNVWLVFDAKIIDTPGIKGFGIVDMERRN